MELAVSVDDHEPAVQPEDGFGSVPDDGAQGYDVQRKAPSEEGLVVGPQVKRCRQRHPMRSVLAPSTRSHSGLTPVAGPTPQPPKRLGGKG